MNKLSLLGVGLTGSLLCASHAQAQAGPGQYDTFKNDTVFTVTNLASLGMFRAGATNRSINQINFTKTPTVDKVGTWTVSMTLIGLSPTYGGATSGNKEYVVFGTYNTNVTPHTYKPNTQANLMNNAANGKYSSGLMLEPRDAICCAVDQNNGIYFSIRQLVTDQFPAPILVSTAAGTPTVPFRNVDPVPCFADKNTLVMVYAQGPTDIYMRRLTPGFTGANLTSAVMGFVQVIASPGKRPFAPTPIIDKAGNLQGLWLAIDDGGSDSDMFFQTGLTWKDKPFKVYDSGGTLNNGGICGGRLFFSNSGSPTSNSAAEVGRVSWLLGSNTKIGTKASLTCGTSNPNRPHSRTVTTVAMSLDFIGAGVIPGVKIGGWNGFFAVKPPILVFASLVASDVDEVAHWEAAVPNDPLLIGFRIAVQGLSDTPGQPLTWTNTATLEFKQ